MRMQGQANCPLDEPPDPGEQLRRSRRGGYHQCQTNQVQWHLPPGGNRTARKCDRQTFTDGMRIADDGADFTSAE